MRILTLLATFALFSVASLAGGPTCITQELGGNWSSCVSTICDGDYGTLTIACKVGGVPDPDSSAIHVEGYSDTIGDDFDTIPIRGFAERTGNFLNHEIADECDSSPWWCSDLASFSCGCTGPQCVYDIAPATTTMYGMTECNWKCTGWEWSEENVFCVEPSPIDDHPCNPEDDPTQPVVDCDEP